MVSAYLLFYVLKDELIRTEIVEISWSELEM
jgi:hypothetical protein